MGVKLAYLPLAGGSHRVFVVKLLLSAGWAGVHGSTRSLVDMENWLFLQRGERGTWKNRQRGVHMQVRSFFYNFF